MNERTRAMSEHGRAVANIFAPVREWVNENKTLTALAEAISKHTGKTVMRQELAKWLHDDEAVRREPGLGMGIIILQTWAQLSKSKFRMYATQTVIGESFTLKKK